MRILWLAALASSALDEREVAFKQRRQLATPCVEQDVRTVDVGSGYVVDTYLDENPTFQNADFGSAEKLVVRGDLQANGNTALLNTREALLKFNLDAVPELGCGDGWDCTCVPLAATLKLFVEGNSPGPITAYRMTTDWTDSYNWNSFGSGVQAADREGVASLDFTVPLTSYGFRSYDVTEDLQAWLGSTSNYGWVFQNPISNQWEFSSSENSNAGRRPLLSITCEAVSCDQDSFTEETCGGVDLHRFDDLASCCEDLPRHDQGELTAYLESLDSSVMGPICMAANFTSTG
jgi:hypothetical protein